MAEAKKSTKKAGAKNEEPKEKQLKHAEVVAETVPAGAAPEVKMEIEEAGTTKAGKRSPKSVREEAEKEAKETRKTEAKQTEAGKTNRPAAKPPRTRQERAGKKYRKAAEQIDRSKTYSLSEALELTTKTSPTKFDATIELHINLGVDPKQADQNVRGTVAMPAGTGKGISVEVLNEASADKIFAKLDKEAVDFDVLIATPDMMPRLGKYARLLGPRGLMPNPKSGTVTSDTDSAVKQAKAGRVEYRVDQAGIVHLAIGKASFGGDKLLQNAEAVLASIRAARPSSIKGIYLKSLYATSTMGPSIKVDTGS